MTQYLRSNFLLFLISTILLTCCFSIISNAQGNDSGLKSRIAHIGFIYPISTNGKNAAEFKNDFSFHVLAGVSGEEDAFCLSGITSIVKGNATGVLISGIYNHVGGNMVGFQMAGILNTSKNAEGLQIAGVMNVAKDADNQIAGVVNVAKKVKGIQVGLINIAEDNKFPIGLINLIANGEQQMGISLDEAGTTLISFRSGGSVLYSIIGLGYNTKYPDARYVIESGMGAHFNILKSFRINLEITSSGLTNFHDDAFMKSSIKVLPAVKFLNGIELFAGPTLNYSGQSNYESSYNFFTLKKFYLGATGGIQINL